MQPNQSQGMNQSNANVPMGGTDPLVGGVRPVAPRPVMQPVQQPVAQPAQAPVASPMQQAAAPVMPQATMASASMSDTTESVSLSDPTGEAAELIDAELNRAASERTVEESPRMQMPQPKKNRGMLIGMILAIVVAVAGIGFGVTMMLMMNDSAASYEKQIATLKSLNNELMNETTADDSEAEMGDTAGYIYMAPWGVKVAVSEDLAAQMVYTIAPEYLTVTIPDTGEVTISRLLTSESDCTDGIDTNTGEEIVCPEVLTTIGDYNYYANLPGDITGTALEELLNPDNYTTF